ncbi:hypothetical protein R1A27_34410 (plasmid) [Methylobacterium sp. NMS12]|uniref:hypothetical protein n=1 Tax=Methylobacterium sp. NMS12 TaxID=3079766 RepID=UPI003F8857EA
MAAMRYALAFALLLTAAGAHAEPFVGGIDGTWLVALVLKDEDGGHGAKASDMPFLAAERCGISVKVLPGKSFEGMDPSLTLVGVGPYASDAAANDNLRRIRQCVPAAYLKRLVYRPL